MTFLLEMDHYNFRRRIPVIIEKCQPPAYAIEQEAGGVDRAQYAVGLMIDQLKQQVPSSKWIQLAILRIDTSSAHALLLREEADITQKIVEAIGSKAYGLQVLQDGECPVGDRIVLSLVYWMADN